MSRSFACGFVVSAVALLSGCGGYGSKVEQGNVEVYYKDGATKDEADRLLAYVGTIMPAVPDRRTLQVVKAGNGYTVRMPVKKEFRDNPTVADALALDGARYSAEVFGGAPVSVEACDERLTTLTVVPPRPDLRRRLRDGKVEIFYPDAGDKADVERLATFLQPEAAASPSPLVTFKFARRGPVVELSMAVNATLVNNPGVKDLLDDLRKKASREVFNGAPTELHLCNELMAPLQTLK